MDSRYGKPTKIGDILKNFVQDSLAMSIIKDTRKENERRQEALNRENKPIEIEEEDICLRFKS